MKRIFLISLTALALTGCYKDAQTTSTEGNGFQVEFLFEKDGIKVYRFRDGGRVHYFTSKGETISSHSSGKNSYEENIN